MPRVKGQPRTISKRHLIGNRQGGGGGVSITAPQTEIQEKVKKLETEVYLNNDHIHLPLNYGIERYQTATNYAPILAPSAVHKIVFGTHVIESQDIYIDRVGAKFYPKVKGIYKIRCNCLATPANAATTQWTSHELYLYKNGVFYSYLDANTVITAFGVGQNYYDGFDNLQGSDFVYLEPNDYIEIGYLFLGLLPFGLTDYLTAYINIEYLTNKSKEL